MTKTERTEALADAVTAVLAGLSRLPMRGFRVEDPEDLEFDCDTEGGYSSLVIVRDDGVRFNINLDLRATRLPPKEATMATALIHPTTVRTQVPDGNYVMLFAGDPEPDGDTVYADTYTFVRTKGGLWEREGGHLLEWSRVLADHAPVFVPVGR